MLMCCLAEFEIKPIRWSPSVAASCPDTLVMHVSSLLDDRICSCQNVSCKLRRRAKRKLHMLFLLRSCREEHDSVI